MESSRYVQLLQQIESAEHEAKAAREEELPLVISHITELMQRYELTLADLGLVKVRRKKISGAAE